MGQGIHYSASRLLDEIQRHPDDVAAHLLACEECRYVFALIRRVAGEPNAEQSEVVVDALRDWRAT